MKTNLFISSFSMKKFLIKSFAYAVILLAVIGIVNYVGDAANIFKEGFETKIAEIICRGENATNISNYDERLTQREIIKCKSFENFTIVLGSSRTMLISNNLLQQKNVFNSSVSGASIEDLIAIYQMYKIRKLRPVKVIVGCDPWLFNENNGQTRWRSIKEYYDMSVGDDGLSEGSSKTAQLISVSYFQSSVKTLFKKTPLPKNTNVPCNAMLTKLIDGSICYGEDFRNAGKNEVEAKAAKYLTGEIYGLKNYREISSRQWELFDSLIQSLLEQNIRVELFLAPYHPKVIKHFRSENRIVFDVQDRLKKYASKMRISLKGSFDPKDVGLESSDFYDGMHLRESGVKKILDMP